MSTPNYHQLLLDIIHYVYHVEISSHLAYKRARIVLLDSMGCAIKTLSQSLEARAFVGPVVPGTTVPNGFRLPGTAFALDPVKGAFDLGLLIRYVDHNDAYSDREWGHPGDNLGSIVAVADWLSRSRAAGDACGKPTTLKEVLTAHIKAYEIQLHQWYLEMLGSLANGDLDDAIPVKIASTAVVAHLLGLSEEQALSALSHAWLDRHLHFAFQQPPNAGPRRGWATGDACSSTVHLCFLAKAGQPGPPWAIMTPKRGFEDIASSNEGFTIPKHFEAFAIENDFRLIAAKERSTSASEAAVELVIRLEVMGRAVSDIEKMTIRTHHNAKSILDKTGPLRNPKERFHCIQYLVAVSLMKGFFIDSDDYADRSPWASDPRVDALRDKMVIVEDEQFTKDYHDPEVDSKANAIQVKMKTGEDISEIVVEFPIGHRKHSKTLDFIQKKFRVNMNKGGFESARVDVITGLVQTNGLAIHHFVDLFAKEVGYVGNP
ncbi:MmgE/PrpD family-domain-containing protein [Hypoxylon rubiginosum]|uniref:MmgE/PrpD family-domain-containing protein n=1 Tax=Hypoxylon rubiginosum TaxID=110542 RepID=A0ACB9Z3E8_9PEZI|nr:MmgE/PrpD family-domain-containing protein [Hypoxylon rubiginosum]